MHDALILARADVSTQHKEGFFRDAFLLRNRCLARRFKRTSVVPIATGNADRYEPAEGIRNTLANDGRRLTKPHK